MDSIHATTERLREEAANAGTTHPTTYSGTSPVKVNKLGHFVYEVTDVERTVKFWTEVMGFQETDRNDHGMVFFRCGKDHHGIGLKPSKSNARPAKDAGLQTEHLAFEVDSIDVLVKAKQFFKENNIPIIFEGRKGAGCNTSINFLDPDGYEFEIYYGIDQVNEDGKLRPASQFRRAKSLDEAIANPVPKEW